MTNERSQEFMDNYVRQVQNIDVSYFLCRTLRTLQEWGRMDPGLKVTWKSVSVFRSRCLQILLEVS